MRRRVVALFLLGTLACLCPTLVLAQGGPPPVVFSGLEVSPLGGALVAVDTIPDPDELVVSSIVTTADGFSLVLGPSQGGALDLLSWPVPPPAQTAVLIIQAVTAGGGSLNPVADLDLATGPAGEQALPDFSPIGASTFRVEVWENDAMVSAFDGQTGAVGTSARPTTCAVDTDGLPGVLPSPMLPAIDQPKLHVLVSLGYPAGTQFSIGVPPQLVSGDELRFLPESPTADTDNIAGFDVTFDLPSGITPASARIGGAALKQFRNLHAARGDAVIRCVAPAVGPEEWPSLEVDIPVGGAGTLDVLLVPAMSGDTEAEDCLIWDIKKGTSGTSDTFSIAGALSNAPGTELTLAAVTSVSSGAQWTVTPDFSPVGATTYDVELFDDTGALVLSATGVTGDFTVSGDDMTVETGAGVTSGDRLHLVLAYPSDETFTIPGHGAHTARRVAMSASSTTGGFDRLHRLSRGVATAPGGTHSATVEKSKFKKATINPAMATTGLAYTSRGPGYVLFHSDPDPGLAGTLGGIVFPDTLWPPDNHENGIEWLPLGSPATGRPGKFADITLKRGGTYAMTAHLVSNGTGVSLFIDPPAGISEVEVVVRDKFGRIKVKFPWTNFTAPALELLDFPIAAVTGRQLKGTGELQDRLTLDFGYEMTLPAVAAATGVGTSATMMTKAELIEILADPPPGASGNPGLAFLADGFDPVVFLDAQPILVAAGEPPSPGTVLHPAYPNPFNPTTTLSFELARTRDVSLRVYAVDGSLVATVHSGRLPAGPHAFTWNSRNAQGEAVASGVYLLELRAGDAVRHAKLNLLK